MNSLYQRIIGPFILTSASYIEFGEILPVPRDISLPENLCLPCAETFAVGQTSGTRQRHGLPCVMRTGTRQRFRTRQRLYMPCARPNSPRRISDTRLNMNLCRVPKRRHTAKMAASHGVWLTVPFAVCLNKAHGKDSVCRVFYFEHTAKVYQKS